MQKETMEVVKVQTRTLLCAMYTVYYVPQSDYLQDTNTQYFTGWISFLPLKALKAVLTQFIFLFFLP